MTDAFMDRAYVSSSADHRASYDEVRAAGHVDGDGAITAAGLAAWGERR